MADTRHAGDDTGPARPSDVAPEQPEDWGWHHEWRRSTPIIGWVATVSLLLMIFGNHIGHVEDLWLIGVAAVMALLLIRGRLKRRNAWRD